MNVSILIHAELLERDDLCAVATACEQAGFEAVWSVEGASDSTVYNHEIAAATEQVTTGSTVAVRWKRHPMQLAETAAAYDHLYPGRFAIGLGSAAWVEDPAEAWMQPRDRPVGRMSEYIDVLRAALSGEQVEYEGEFYRVKGKLDFGLGRRVPIHLAAGGPQLCRLAGRKADGVAFEIGGPELVGARIDAVREGAEQIGRSCEEISLHQTVIAAVGPDLEAAREPVRRYVVKRSQERQYRRDILAESGFREVAEEVGRLVESEDLDAAGAAIPDGVVDAISLPFAETDSAATVRARVEALRVDCIDCITMYPCSWSGDWAGDYIALARLVGRESVSLPGGRQSRGEE